MAGPEDDRHFMGQALRLARRGAGLTSPNPMVGALVVLDGEIVGSGWHHAAGLPHAEIEAIAEAGSQARGATLYVSLEPCSHTGRTPPCAPAVVEAGIARVVAALQDPNPSVSGSGFEILKQGGVEVSYGVLEVESSKLNEAYLMHQRVGRPFVTYKAAMTIDGRTAAADGSSKWITSQPARNDVQRLRALSDGICVGIGTVVSDNPALTVRTGRKRRSPARVVVDTDARTPIDANVMSTDAPTIIAVGEGAPKQRLAYLERAGAEVLVVPRDGEHLSIPKVLEELGSRAMISLLLEGGATVAGALARANLIDKYVLYLAPKLLGSVGTKGVLEGWGASTMGEAKSLEIDSVRKIGEDIRVVAYPGRTSTEKA